MAIVFSGDIAIKDDTLQAGSTSIALEVDGNITGDKHLNDLGTTAGLNTGGTSMTEFYGYSSAPFPDPPTNVNIQQTNLSCTPTAYQITWNAVSGATNYRVEFRVNTGAWQFAANTTALFYNGSFALGQVDGDSLGGRVRVTTAGGTSGYGEDPSPDIIACGV